MTCHLIDCGNIQITMNGLRRGLGLKIGHLGVILQVGCVLLNTVALKKENLLRLRCGTRSNVEVLTRNGATRSKLTTIGVIGGEGEGRGVTASTRSGISESTSRSPTCELTK